jgi:hypothetical protein
MATTHWRDRLHLLIWVALATGGIGLALLLTTTWMIFLTTSAGDLVAAYRVGQEPWTSIAIVLVLVGATATVALGGIGTLARLDLVRAVLLIFPVLVAVAWWAAALDVVRYPGFRGPDPVGFAFSLPIPAAVGLLLPALGAAVLAMSADPERRPPLRMRPVHDESSPPREPGVDG